MDRFEMILTAEELRDFKKKFKSKEKYLLAQNICCRSDCYEVAQRAEFLDELVPDWNHKVETEGKPVADQGSADLCWLYGGLNAMRLPFMNHHNLDEFEFSQNHLLFWYKLESCNFFLHNIVEATRRKEPLDGHMMIQLLMNPITDSGQWQIFVNLVNKYGVLPKKCFLESFNKENPGRMNDILLDLLHKYAKEVRQLAEKGRSNFDIRDLIHEQMSVIYRVLSICLGTPREDFVWNYYNKFKQFCSVGPVNPKEFYEQHVKPFFNVDDKVYLMNDPRPTMEYGKLYTVDFRNNIVGGKKYDLNNQDAELLLQLTASSIKEGEAVCFYCELPRRFSHKQGMKSKMKNFPLVFGVDLDNTLSKADRLIYRENGISHCMLFTAMKTNDADEVTHLQAENSWGSSWGQEGKMFIVPEWFKEFVFGIVVDKKFVSQEVMDVFEQEPIVMPFWDPVGAM